MNGTIDREMETLLLYIKLAGGGKILDLKTAVRILSRRHGERELVERLLKANRIPEASMVVKGMSKLIKLRYNILIKSISTKHYQEIYHESMQEKDRAMKALTKVKMPTSTPPQTTPGKSAKSRVTESAMEEPLFQERGIDSLYNVSGEKDRFQLGNPDGSSMKRPTSGRDSIAPQFQMDDAGAYDYGAFNSDYDVSGLFHMADQAIGNQANRGELFSREKIREGTAARDAREASRMAESVILLDRLEHLYFDKFEQKGDIKNFDTTLNRTLALQESGFVRPDDNRSVHYVSQSLLHNASMAQTRKLNKRLVSDESTMLPSTDMKLSFNADASLIVNGIDWSKFQVSLLEPEESFEAPFISVDDAEVTKTLISVLKSGSKLRNDTTFGKPEGDSEELENVRDRSGFHEGSNLLNQITFSKPNLGIDQINPLSTIHENMTDELFGTLMPGYQAGLDAWDYLSNNQDIMTLPVQEEMLEPELTEEGLEEKCSKILNMAMVNSKKVPRTTDSYGVEFSMLLPNLTLEHNKQRDSEDKVDMVQAIQCFLKMAMNDQLKIHQENVLSVSPVFLCAL